MRWLFDRAGPAANSRITLTTVLPSAQGDAVGTPISDDFAALSPRLRVPLPTLRRRLADGRRTARGHRDSLSLRCRAFSSLSPGRFYPGAFPLGSTPAAIRGCFTATTSGSASAPGNGTRLLADSAAWRSPSRRGRHRSSVRARLHAFHRSASIGLMLPVCRTPPGQ